ncbi:hypothetical protein E4U59_006607 [Claviceps monticola]|nr:hypothetical protein E4U59_006607 [Claviceps monticola]
MLVQTDPSPAQQEGSARAGDSQSSSSSFYGPDSGGPTASHMTLSNLQPVGGPPATLNGSQRVFNVEPDMRDILLGAGKALLRNYDNLLRIFCNCRPVLENADVLYTCIEYQYDALAVVRLCVEHLLLQFQSRLWVSVARFTRNYLNFGYLARSKVIFKEALIHTVGIWYLCIPEKPDLDVPDFVLDIAEDKVYQLQEKVSRAEGQLFRLSLTTEQGEPLDSDSPSAFLDHNDCEAFLALHPLLHTAENLVRFGKRMADLKAMAQDRVRSLLHNNLELDVASPDISEETMYTPFYFTCTTVQRMVT